MKKASIGFGVAIFFVGVTFGQVPLEGIGTNSSAQNEAGRLRSALLFQKVIELDRKSTRLNSSHITLSRMPSSA